jgi:HK97 family phage major capsid protein
MQALADNCDAKGSFDGEDQERMVKMTADAKALKEQIKAEAEAEGTLADTKAFLAALGTTVDEEEAAKGTGATYTGTLERPTAKSLGEAFVESAAYKDFVGRYGGAGGVIPSSVKGIQSAPFESAGFKDLVTGGSATSAGAAVINDRYPTLTDLVGERELTVRDLVTNGSTSSDTVEYVRVTGKTNNASPVVEASATSGTSGTKPESALTLEVVSTTVKTIAHWIPITKRAASDAPQVRTLVDNFLRYGLREEEEDQILNGDGTGENFTGILNTSGILSVGSAGTDLDAVVDAIRTVRVTGRRRATAIVMHPNDFWSTGFALAKDSTGNYLLGNGIITTGANNASLWGLRLVVTEAMTENTALVGDFRQAVLWDREQASISVSDSHSDFFIRNMLAVLAEERFAFGVLDPQAFCTVQAI